MHYLYNVFADGTAAAFELSCSQWPRAHRRLTTGALLDDLLAGFGLAGATSVSIKSARWYYVGDYCDATDWHDRWKPVTLVNVTLRAASTCNVWQTLKPADAFGDLEDRLWEISDRERAVDGDEANHDALALLVADVPQHVELPSELLEMLARAGEIETRILTGPKNFARRAPMRQLRVQASARFPDDVAQLEAIIAALRAAGASVDWRSTTPPVPR